MLFVHLFIYFTRVNLCPFPLGVGTWTFLFTIKHRTPELTDVLPMTLNAHYASTADTITS